MTIHTDTGFSTGPYTVVRAGLGTWNASGKHVRAASTTFQIDAAEYPSSGLSGSQQPSGEETSETRTLFTDTALFPATDSASVSGQPGVGREADLILIDGHTWRVTSVKHYKALSGHYVVTVTRLYTGEAS